MIFDSWYDIFDIIVVGICTYVILVLTLRWFGKRTLATMHAYDLVITVALGSLLARIILSKDVALLEGVTAIVLLIALQFVFSRSALHSSTMRNLIKAQPVMLLYRGNFLYDAMHRERVGEEEIIATLRQNNINTIGQVDAVILEANGSLSVLTGIEDTNSILLSNVRNHQQETPALPETHEQSTRRSDQEKPIH
jgi:uncharacterized membrane protein YcaP (DUF421 family)